MSLKSSPTRYGTVAIVIHWLTAIAVLGMLVSGLAAHNATDEVLRLTLLRGHAVTGSLVGILTLLRIVWWLFLDRRPADAAGLSRGQAVAVHIVHYGLYAVILVMVTSGIATVILSGGVAQLTKSLAIAYAEARLSGQGRLVIRKSGTEPLIRVMAEGEDPALVEQLVDQICEAVQAA